VGKGLGFPTFVQPFPFTYVVLQMQAMKMIIFLLYSIHRKLISIYEKRRLYCMRILFSSFKEFLPSPPNEAHILSISLKNLGLIIIR